MKNGLADLSWGRITENIGPENTEFPLKYKTLAETSKISVNSHFLARILIFFRLQKVENLPLLSSPTVVSFPRASVTRYNKKVKPEVGHKTGSGLSLRHVNPLKHKFNFSGSL